MVSDYREEGKTYDIILARMVPFAADWEATVEVNALTKLGRQGTQAISLQAAHVGFCCAKLLSCMTFKMKAGKDRRIQDDCGCQRIVKVSLVVVW
jgi:hypothetical protein